MNRQTVTPDQLVCPPFTAWDKGWYLLTAGDFAAKQFNSMTVSWGFFGTIWAKPMAICVARPQRHTYQFTEQYDTFTLCAFGEEHRKTLNVLGTKSGRSCLVSTRATLPWWTSCAAIRAPCWCTRSVSLRSPGTASSVEIAI